MIKIRHESPMTWEQRWIELREWVERGKEGVENLDNYREIREFLTQLQQEFLDAMNELERR